jgi:hypothetical protein
LENLAVGERIILKLIETAGRVGADFVKSDSG